jgi:class 3 adenylate cyclase/tetratricopeptide (TPR) repeat protein
VNPAPAPEVRKVVSAVFCDWVGSTALADRLDVETVRRVQARYFEEMRSAIERFGGTVEKYIGDAVVGMFGVPVLHEDDALRAVRAAVAMRDALTPLNIELKQEWGVSVSTRIGVNTGEVVTGEEEPNREPFATGDAMNVASRLEQVAEPGEILIGSETYSLVRDAVRVIPIEPLRVKGKRLAIPAWRLIDLDPAAVARRPRFDAPLVGRDAEFATLHGILESAWRAGRGQVMTILGDAGVGKSRLAEELERSLHSETIVLRGRCLPYGEGMTFWPIAEVIRQACGIREDDSADEAQAKIAQAVRKEARHALVCRRLAGVLGLVEDSGESEETFWAFRRLLESLAGRRPVLVVIDDLHWGEPTLLDLIEYLVRTMRDAPVVLLCLARRELSAKREALVNDFPEAPAVVIDPLTPEESDLLLTSLIGGGALDEAIGTHIAEAARGNPLFIEEMLGMLVDKGLLHRKRGTWLATGDLSRVAVPLTIDALLSARLEALPRGEGEVLEAAAVIGKEFWADAVVELMPEELRAGVPGYLGSLVRRGLLESDGERFAGHDPLRFHHMLVGDVAYRRIPKVRRSGLHQRFAELLERRWGDRLPEYEEIAGYHLEQGYRLRKELGPVSETTRAMRFKAGAHFASAGRRAFGRGDMTAAIKLLERAASLLPRTDHRRLYVLLDLGVALMQVGKLVQSERTFEHAVKRARMARDRTRRLYAEIELAGLRFDAYPEHGIKKILSEVKGARSFFEARGDDVGLAKVWRRLGFVDGVRSCWRPAREAFEQALEHARLANAQREEAVAASMLFYCYLYGPDPVDDAISACERLLSDGRTYWGVEAVGRCCLAGLYAMRTQFGEARELLTRSRGAFAELGQMGRMAESAFVAGTVEMLAGDFAAAEREFRPAYDALEESELRGLRASLAACLAEPLFLLGRYGEARKLTVDSEQLAGEDDVFSQVRWRSVRAQLLARAGDAAAAEEIAQDAVARAFLRGDNLNLQAGAVLSLAEVLDVSRRREGAQAAAAKAVGLYAQRGNVAARERAKLFAARLTEDAVEREVQLRSS